MSTPTESITIQVPNAAVAESLQAYAQMHWSGVPDDAEYQRADGTWAKCDRVPALFRWAVVMPTSLGFNPGEGYRLLEEGEVIQEGDEYESLSRGWQKSDCAGETFLRARY